MLDTVHAEGVLALGSRLRSLSDRLFAQGDQAYAERGFNVRARWFPVLAALRDGVPRSVTQIAETTGLSHPYVISLTRKMMAAGYLTDARDPDDERRRLIGLSPEGRLLVLELEPMWACLRTVAADTLARCGSDLLAALERFEADIARQPWPDAVADKLGPPITVVDYTPELQADFKRLNVEWLEQYFEVEPSDLAVLDDPEGTILATGGVILLARSGERSVGTSALRHHGDGVYELTKMGVTGGRRHAGIGARLMAAILARYQALGGRELYLETNHVLEPAIRLYRRFGFVDQGHRKPDTAYARSDVYMVWEGAG